MKIRKSIMLFLVAIMMLLTACGPGEKKSKTGGGETVDASKFPIETTNKEPAVKDAVLKVAIVKDSPLIGIFYSDIGQGDGFDGTLIATFFRNEIFDLDENFEITDTGMATLSVDAPNKKATIKIKDGVKWSDGQPLTADDIIFAYKVIGSKDYTGVRYNDDNEKVVGMKEYHEGKAQDISGLKKIDDKTVEVSFTELGQGVYTGGNGLIASALPEHHLKDIPIKDLEKSEKVRNKMITLGAYTIVSGVQGESLELKANPYHFRGKPKIEKATVEVVNSNTIVSALKTGKYDMALRIPTDLYKSYKDLNNLEILGRQELYYSYMAFKVGHFDKVKGENITDPNAKMADVRLRQALVYGLDVEQMVKAFYYGLRERATMAVPPAFKKYYSKDIPGFPYNPEKAKQLLKEANYDSSKPLILTYYYNDQASQDFMQAVSYQLDQVGIKNEVTQITSDATTGLFKTRKYDLGYKGLSSFGYESWYGEYASTNTNFKNITNGDTSFDELNKKLAETSDVKERNAILAELQKLEQEKLLKLNLFTFKNFLYLNTEKVSIPDDVQFGNPFYKFDYKFENWDAK